MLRNGDSNMNIVIEGPDGSGKSTLARYLRDTLGRTLIGGEGPAKYPGEFDQRIARFFSYQNVIFDRHPAVSGPIYDQFRENVVPVSADLLYRFYEESYIFVYCRGSIELKHNAEDNASGSDTPEYLDWLSRHHSAIFTTYEDWGLNRAHIVYRLGNPMTNVLKAVRGMLA